MEKIKYYLPSIIFNLAEVSVIILAGKLLNKCAIWSLLIFLSLFVLTNVGLGVSIIMAIFCAFILTTKGDIRDGFQWKGKETKYADIEEYIKYNSMETKLIEYEEKLKNQDNLTFLIYKYRFKDKMTFAQISERLDLENPRIVEKTKSNCF